jgi:hypothetical protein
MEAIVRSAAPLFDDLPKPAVRKLESCAVNIEKLRSKGVELIFAMGRELKIAHDELANHGDGGFGKWCKERCGINRSTAFRYIGVVETFSGEVCCRLQQTATAEALYLLSRDTTPQDAIDKAIEVAEQGERITLAKAKEIVKEVAGVVIDAKPTSVKSAPVVDADSFDLSEALVSLRDQFAAEAEYWPATMREELVHFWKQVATDRAGDESWLKGE